MMRADATAEQIEVGWWPGDARYPRAAFYAFAFPEPAGFATGAVSPPAAHWDTALGEFIFDWDDALRHPDPHSAAIEFGRSVIEHACTVCDWDTGLASSAQGVPPPVQ